MASLLAAAHRNFLAILAETNRLSEIRKRCGNDPFLLHEFGKLQAKIAQYNEKQAEMGKWQESGENEPASLEPEVEGRKAPGNGSSLRIYKSGV